MCKDTCFFFISPNLLVGKMLGICIFALLGGGRFSRLAGERSGENVGNEYFLFVLAGVLGHSIVIKSPI